MSQDEKNRSFRPFHERPFGDILQSLDSFFQDTVKQIKVPRLISTYQYETKKEYIIEAELPGVKKNQVSLDIFSNYIKIAVQTEEIIEEQDDNKLTYKHNSRYSKAEKLVHLPFIVNESEVKATLKDGLLQIRIPNKRKKISIE